MEILPNETTAFNHIKQSIYEHKIMILSDLQQMTEHDGYQDWRLREKENLENIFQARFNATQFAKKCGKVRHLKCYDNFSDCDWGKRSYFYKLYIPDKICYKISKAQKLKILKTQNLQKLEKLKISNGSKSRMLKISKTKNFKSSKSGKLKISKNSKSQKTQNLEKLKISKVQNLENLKIL
jgi:hypothetical protein